MSDDEILKQLGARLREEREEDARTEAPPLDRALEDRLVARILEAAPPKRAEVRPIRPWAWLAAPLAAAAAVVLFVATRGEREGLPGYEVAVVSAADVRDPSRAPAPSREVTLDPDGELELVARPAQPTAGVVARAVLVDDGRAVPWHVPIDVSPQGAVRIAGRTRALFPDVTRTHDVAVVVGRSASLRSDEDAVKIAESAANAADSRVLRVRIRFVEKK